MDEVYQLDLREYRLLCKAQAYKNVDFDYRIHELAFACNKATLRNKQGRLIYAKFSKLFDYDKAINSIGKKDKKEAKSQNRITAYERYLEFMSKKKEGRSK